MAIAVNVLLQEQNKMATAMLIVLQKYKRKPVAVLIVLQEQDKMATAMQIVLQEYK